jgi:hypothetical protein
LIDSGVIILIYVSSRRDASTDALRVTTIMKYCASPTNIWEEKQERIGEDFLSGIHTYVPVTFYPLLRRILLLEDRSCWGLVWFYSSNVDTLLSHLIIIAVALGVNTLNILVDSKLMSLINGI